MKRPPELSPDVILWLLAITEQPHDRMSERDYWMRLGALKLIRSLANVYEKQTGTKLETTHVFRTASQPASPGGASSPAPGS